MKKLKIVFVLLFIIPSLKIFGQDCRCKQWLKEHYSAMSGKIQYDYEFGCNQPGSEFRFIGYDNEYCNKLIELDRQKAQDVINTKEANEVLKNVVKQEYKDGYKVIDWGMKSLGNTGKWSDVGEPLAGINDSSIIYWGKFQAKVKEGKIYGLVEFNYEYPILAFEEFKIFNSIEKPKLVPDYVFFNETKSFKKFSTSLENIRKDGNMYGYVNSKGEYSICKYYYFNNDETILYTGTTDEASASMEYYKFKSEQNKLDLNHLKSDYTLFRNKLKIIDSIEKILKSVKIKNLDDLEKEICGKWNFATNCPNDISALRTAAPLSFALNENIFLNEDHTFEFNGYLTRCFMGKEGLVEKNVFNKKGCWYRKQDTIFFIQNIVHNEFNFSNSININDINIILLETIKILNELDSIEIEASGNDKTWSKLILYNYFQYDQKWSKPIFDKYTQYDDLHKKLTEVMRLFYMSESQLINKSFFHYDFQKLNSKKAIRKKSNLNNSLIYNLGPLNMKPEDVDEIIKLNAQFIEGKKEKSN